MAKQAPTDFLEKLSAQEKRLVEVAAHHLNSGCTVAIPTETVYGLAARIDSAEGIAAIFRLKERPSFDPLIVHVAQVDDVHQVAAEWPETAQSLTTRFWPGPLTVVVKKKPEINSMITSGLETVGLRLPKHPLARALIHAAGAPLAAPSANRFGRTSPTAAFHVQTEFPDAIARGEILVLDGGPCEVGLESTVCLVSDFEVTILRPGGITEEALREHFAHDPRVSVKIALGHQASPGHTEHHYETKKPLIVSWKASLTDASYDIDGRTFARERIHELFLPAEPALAARALYSQLREGDQHVQSDALFIRRDLRDASGGLWTAIDDRLKRAARLQIPKPKE